jgi:hypothetical protein
LADARPALWVVLPAASSFGAEVPPVSGREVDCTIRDVLDPVVDAVGPNGAAD